MQQRRRSDDGRQCRNTWSGLGNLSKEVGSQKKKRERREVQNEILAHQEEQGFSEELHEDGGQEVATSGYGASKDLGSACGRVGPYRKI